MHACSAEAKVYSLAASAYCVVMGTGMTGAPSVSDLMAPNDTPAACVSRARTLRLVLRHRSPAAAGGEGALAAACPQGGCQQGSCPPTSASTLAAFWALATAALRASLAFSCCSWGLSSACSASGHGLFSDARGRGPGL